MRPTSSIRCAADRYGCCFTEKMTMSRTSLKGASSFSRQVLPTVAIDGVFRLLTDAHVVLRRANAAEEGRHLALQIFGARGQPFRPLRDLARRRGAAAGGLLDRANFQRRARGVAGHRLHAADDVAG